MKRFALVCALAGPAVASSVLWGAVPATGHAQQRDRGALARAVVQALSGHESVPGPETFRRMGPGVEGVLARLARDPGQPGFVRLRAVQVAAVLGTPAGDRIVARALSSSEPLVVRAAVLGLAASQGPRATDAIARTLLHPDVAVREGAILALGRIASPEAHAHLRSRLDAEPDAELRAQITRALTLPPTSPNQDPRP